jgi:Fructose-2,6-bisphosphatase
MDILVIRHAQSEADILNVMEGRADFSLTELGLRQAALMAEWAKGYMSLTKIIASPLKRARQTAEALSNVTGISAMYDDDLMEWQNGLIAGLKREEANKEYPMPEKRFLHTAMYGQESMIAFRARAESALSRMINENPTDSKIAVISHGGMINMLFRSLVEARNNTEVSISTGDTGIHHWQIEGNIRRIVKTNSQIHLASIL